MDVCNRFAVKPLRWLQFLGYTIYGREGDLSTSPDGSQSLDPFKLVELCLSLKQKRRAFLTFTGMITELIQTPKRLTAALNFAMHWKNATRHIFLQTHPLDTAKELISTRTPKEASQSRTLRPKDINDVQNGLLLAMGLHVYLKLGDSAFLQTPNFAVSNSDVPPSPRPIHGAPNPTGVRFILQHFHPPEEFMTNICSHNLDPTSHQI